MWKKAGILLFLVLMANQLNAQDLTGKWVAVTTMESGYYAELELVQNTENVYAGHSYDTENGGYCRHWLDAKFNPSNLSFTGRDVELIDKSKGHEATTYNLKYSKEGDHEYLTGTQNIFYLRMNPFGEYVVTGYTSDFSFIRYVKVKDKYEVHNPNMPNAMTPFEIQLEKSAYPESLKKEESTTNSPIEIPLDSISIDVPEPEITTPPSPPASPEVVETPEEKELTQLRDTRKDKVFSRLRLQTKNIKLVVRDYGKEDNDTVTIFLNQKIIAQKMKITNAAKTFDLTIDPNLGVNELVFVANNLGEIAPNTARVVIWADDKKYEYKLFTNEQQNAVIELEFNDQELKVSK